MQKRLLPLIVATIITLIFQVHSTQAMETAYPGYFPCDGSMYYSIPVFIPPMPAPNPFAILACNEDNLPEEELLLANCFKTADHGLIALADASGITPLHIAIHKGYKELAAKFFKLLSKENKKAVLHIQDLYGNAPFHLAIHVGCLGLANQFFRSLKKFEKTAIFRLRDQYQRTVLHLLFRKLHLAVTNDKSVEYLQALLSLATDIAPDADLSDCIRKTNDDGAEWGSSARTYYNSHLAQPLSNLSASSPLKKLANLLNEQMYMPTKKDIDRVPEVIGMFSQASLGEHESSSLPVSPSQIVHRKADGRNKKSSRQIAAPDRNVEIVVELPKEPVLASSAKAPQAKERADAWTMVSYKGNGNVAQQQQQVAESKKASTETVIAVKDSAAKASTKKSAPAASNDVNTLPNGQCIAISEALKADQKPAPLSPHDQLSQALADGKTAAIKKILKANPGLLKTWRSATGKTLLYLALEANSITWAEEIADACKALITTKNTGSDETPITFILAHGADNTALGELLEYWHALDYINLDTPYQKKRTLRAVAEEKSVVQTAAEREAAAKSASEAARPFKKKTTLKQKRDENAAAKKAASENNIALYTDAPLPPMSYETLELYSLIKSADPAKPETLAALQAQDEKLVKLQFLPHVNFANTLNQKKLCLRPYYSALIEAATMAKNIHSFRYFLAKITDDLNSPIDKCPHSKQTALTYIFRCYDIAGEYWARPIPQETEDFLLAILDALHTHPGFNVNQADVYGITPLQLATAKCQSPRLIQKLLEMGADRMMQKTFDPESALEALIKASSDDSQATVITTDQYAIDPLLASAKGHIDREDATIVSPSLERALACLHAFIETIDDEPQSECLMQTMSRFMDNSSQSPLIKMYFDRHPETLLSWVSILGSQRTLPLFIYKNALDMFDTLCSINPELVARELLRPSIVTMHGKDGLNLLQITIKNMLQQDTRTLAYQAFLPSIRRLLELAPLNVWLETLESQEQEIITATLANIAFDTTKITPQPLVDTSGVAIPLAREWV